MITERHLLEFMTIMVLIVLHLSLRVHIIPTFIRHARQQGLVSEEALRAAITEIDEEFYTFLQDEVRRSAANSLTEAANVANAGSSCLAGLICQQRLYLGNLGDSRAIMGVESTSRSLWGNVTRIVAEQITNDHSVSDENIRKELIQEHKDEPFVVAKRAEVWRIKGISETSRSIGDYYLKRTDYNIPLLPRPSIRRPLVRNDAEMHIRTLTPQDRFIVLASAGFWELITNQEAVDIVLNNPREGIAGTVLWEAWNAARGNLTKNISIMVLFLDQTLLGQFAEIQMDLNRLNYPDFTGATTPIQEYELS